MKKVLTAILTGVSFLTFGQSIPENLSDLVRAEKAFSKLSYDRGIAFSFIENLSPAAILLQGGNEVNGVESMKKLAPDTTDASVVTWEPAFADISSAGDFGFTTGAVKIEKSKKDTTVVAGWTYTSVWQKNSEGQWKLIFDLGGGTAINRNRPLVYSAYPLPKQKNRIDAAKQLKDVLATDEKYNSQITGGPNSFDPEKFSVEGRLHRAGAEPLIGTEAIKNYKDKPNRVFNFKQLNAKIAASGDLAYSYGKLEAVIAENGKTRNVAVGYLRIWKKYRDEWKVLIDVLG